MTSTCRGCGEPLSHPHLFHGSHVNCARDWIPNPDGMSALSLPEAAAMLDAHVIAVIDNDHDE